MAWDGTAAEACKKARSAAKVKRFTSISICSRHGYPTLRTKDALLNHADEVLRLHWLESIGARGVVLEDARRRDAHD